MNIIRIVYEKGVEARLHEDGKWRFSSNPNRNKTVGIKDLKQEYGLNPILIAERFKGWQNQITERTFLLLPGANKLYELEASDLISSVPPRFPTYEKGLNIQYIIEAVNYHCKNLVEQYALIARRYSEIIIRFKSEGDRRGLFQGRSEPYFEFDALVTVIKRAYDSTRYVVWELFGPKNSSIPSSFYRTIQSCSIPIELKERLEKSWNTVGEKLTDYRDCIQHYSPIYFGLTSVHMNKIDDGPWSVSVLIPDNPKARSMSKFKFEKNIDALDFGWKSAAEILDISSLILEAIKKYAV